MLKSKKEQTMDEIVWVDKYRPRKVEQMILPERLMERHKDGQLTNNLLFKGTSGIGKTTLAKILCEGRSTLFINGSLETSIDVVREKITQFASTKSLVNGSRKKVILIDEAERFSESAQKSLKSTMEQYSHNVYYVLTSNHPEKLDDKLCSRLTEVDFNFTDTERKHQQKGYITRIKGILMKEGRWTISNDALIMLMKTHYPDLRKMLNVLYYTTRPLEKGAKIGVDDIDQNKIDSDTELYETIIKEVSPEKLYSYIKGRFQGRESVGLQALGSPFLNWLNKSDGYKNKTLPCSVVVHKYTYEATTGSIDPLLPLLACAKALSDLFRSKN